MAKEKRGSKEEPATGGCFKAFLIAFLSASAITAGAIAYYRYCYMPSPEPPLVTESLRAASRCYDSLGEFYDGVAQAKRGDETFYIDTRGRLTDAPDPEKRGIHTPDHTELQRVERNGMWGMVNLVTRDTVIKPQYSTLSNFYGGFALATVKFGRPEDPEYTCFYGYVDTRGNHTFTTAQFEAVKQAASRAARREYIATLPHGITARSLGLPERTAAISRPDSLGGTWEMGFDAKGVITRLLYTDRLGDTRHYGIIDGYITSTSVTLPGGIRQYSYTRVKDGPCSERIMRHSVEGIVQVGYITYSPDDGTVIEAVFETLN